MEITVLSSKPIALCFSSWFWSKRSVAICPLLQLCSMNPLAMLPLLFSALPNRDHSTTHTPQRHGNEIHSAAHYCRVAWLHLCANRIRALSLALPSVGANSIRHRAMMHTIRE